MLVADAITKHYDTPRGRVPILEGVSFRLDRGEAMAIMGPSGCGKSTLLYVLGALEPPSDGEVTIDGTNPYALDERQQASFRGATIGFVFQDHLLLPQLSALDNVIAPTLVAGKGRSPAEHRERARALLHDVGLGDRLDHRPGELSGGERQRVAVARALVRHPAVLLCDEPTGNLDRAAADGVADLLLRLHAERKTMLVVVTHSPALAARFGRRFELGDCRLVEA
jgi:lipoprotein-releasing system ATP-binding protein